MLQRAICFSAKLKKYVGTKMVLFIVFIGTKDSTFLKIYATAQTRGFAWSCHEGASTFPLCSFSQKWAYREKKRKILGRKNQFVF